MASFNVDFNTVSDQSGTHRKDEPNETTPILAHGRSFSGSRLPRHRDNSFQDIDGFSTFLASPLASSDSVEFVGDNATTLALNEVKIKVHKPYTILLKLVAWDPIFPNRTLCYKILNNLHVCLVTLIIIGGYFLQLAACFRRDSAKPDAEDSTLFKNSTSGSNECDRFYLSQYIIPDIIHSVAYFYSLYIFRYKKSEQLSTLINTVFLQASPGGDLSQKQLIKDMRTTLGLAVLWLICSFLTVVMYMVSKSEEQMFTFLNIKDQVTKVILIALLVTGLFMLDLVYINVVINYCVQCSLLKFYFEGIIEKITHRIIDMERAIKDIGIGRRYISTLNDSSATAMSLVLFNFGTMVVLAMLSFMHPNKSYTVLMYISTVLSMVNWFVIFLVPLFLAAKLTRTCRRVESLGNELRMRPFVFADVAREELDSFLLFTSTLNMNARIFQIPMKHSYIFCIMVLLFFSFLLLLQTGMIHFYIGDKQFD